MQTLHPEKFDHGQIIAQDAFELAEDHISTYPVLRDYMAERGARLLLKALRERTFMQPSEAPANIVIPPASEAPKLTKEDAHIDWQTWSASYILRAQKAMGSLWSILPYEAVDKATGSTSPKTLRIQWHDFRLQDPQSAGTIHQQAAGIPLESGCIATCDGLLISPTSVTIEGRKRGWPGDAKKVMQHLLSLTHKQHEKQQTLR